MGIPKRLTAPRKIISREDTALAFLDVDVLKRYWETFDVGVLGDLDDPCVFDVLPLRPEYSRYDSGPQRTADEAWVIFAYHVTGVSDPEFALTFDGRESGRHIADDCRALFPDAIIRDVADMICQLANSDGVKVPFAISPTARATTMRYRLNLAEFLERSARTVDAKTSG